MCSPYLLENAVTTLIDLRAFPKQATHPANDLPLYGLDLCLDPDPAGDVEIQIAVAQICLLHWCVGDWLMAHLVFAEEGVQHVGQALLSVDELRFFDRLAGYPGDKTADEFASGQGPRNVALDWTAMPLALAPRPWFIGAKPPAVMGIRSDSLLLYPTPGIRLA